MIIYFQRSSGSITEVQKMSNNALAGEQVYQDYNCAACHQIYGLGGYLGPDLTNVISNPSKGPDYVNTIINSGIQAMPKFDLSDQKRDQLVAFLTHVDQTGFYPNKNAVFSEDGWVDIEYK